MLHIALPIQDYVCLVDDPRPSSPRGRAFTVEWLGNVAGAPPVVYLNAGIDVMRELAAESITAGEPVWFGCDTAQMRRVDVGLLRGQDRRADGEHGRQPEHAHGSQGFHPSMIADPPVGCRA